MAKRHKPEEIVAKRRQVEVLTSQGSTVADAVRQIGVTEITSYGTLILHSFPPIRENRDIDWPPTRSVSCSRGADR